MLHRRGTLGKAIASCPHLLIFTIYYWPEIIGIPPYVTRCAEHLAKRGWRVTVFTAMPHYPEWRIHEEYRGRWLHHETVNGVTIHRMRQYVPRRQSAARRALYEGSFLAHTLSLVSRRDPDVILGVVPSLSGGILAAAAARRYRVPFGLIFQDLVGTAAGQSGMPGGGKVARGTRTIEGWLARRASRVGVVTEGFRPYLEGLGVVPERIRLLPNWSHVPHPTRCRDEMRSELGWAEGSQIVMYAGNMGLKQGLEQVIAAAKLAATSRPHVRFVFMGTGSQRAVLASLAANCTNVTFVDSQSNQRYMNMLAAADVLLVNERKSVVDMALPSKLTSYFVAGRPIVAAVAPEGTTAREVRRSGGGLTVPAEDPRALLHALDRLVADRALADRLAAAGRRYAAEFLNEEIALVRMEQFISELIDPAGNSPAAEPLPGATPRDESRDETTEAHAVLRSVRRG